MKITRTDECPCDELELDDLVVGDVFKFSDATADGTFLIVRKVRPSREYVRRHGLPRRWKDTLVVCLDNGNICANFPKRLQRAVIRLNAELVTSISEDQS